MEFKKEATKKKRPLIWKIGKVLGWMVVSFIFLIILILILIQTSFVQNFARKKVVSYLENKFKTKVAIGKFTVKFPTALSLQNVFFEDQSQDTLLYGGEIKVDVDMPALIRKKISINEIALNDIVAKVKRLPPDSVFNFQYIIDAFSNGTKDTTQKEDTSSLKINIGRILVNKTRIVYKDLLAGNDLDLMLGHFDTRITRFDPSHLVFDFPSITLNGLNGHFYQLKPLKEPAKETAAKANTQPEIDLQFLNKEINVSDIDFAYNSEPSDIKTSFKIEQAALHPKNIDIKNMMFGLKDAAINNAAIAIETAASGKAATRLKDTATPTSASPYLKIMSDDIAVKNLNLKYDDNSAPHAPAGMDYSHLGLQQLSVDASGVEYCADSIIAHVKSASMKEKSGFILNNLATDFYMMPNGVFLYNLLMQTPGTELSNRAYITYASLDAIKKNPGELGLYFDLQHSKISMKDLWTFVPQLKVQTPSLSPTSTLYIDAKITGKVSELYFQKLILKGLTTTDINVTGAVKGLPQPKKLYADLTIHQFQTSKQDLLSFIPKSSLPQTITLPHIILVKGTIRGGMNKLNTNLVVNTNLGNATVQASLQNITDKNKSRYDVSLKAANLALGTLMQNSKLGSISGSFKVIGHGFNPPTANAVFNATVKSITLNGYTYHDIKAEGTLTDKSYKINASIGDSNLTASLHSHGIFSAKYPTLHLAATIDSIKTMPLHFTTQPVIYHGQIEGNFASINPDSLVGNLAVTHSILINNGKRITLDSIIAIASGEPGNQLLSLKTDFLSASVKGAYKLTQLGSVFQQSINPYFSITENRDSIKTDPYHFTVNGEISNNPTLKALLPELTQLDPITLSGTFASDSGWNLRLKSPHIIYGASVIDSANFMAGTQEGSLEFTTSVRRIITGSSFSMYATRLSGTMKNNKLDFDVAVKDRDSKDKYRISGVLNQPALNHYTFSLSPDDLLLNYHQWTALADNQIQYFKGDINAHHFVLNRDDQQLSINSADTSANAPLQIDFTNFNLSTITAFTNTDSLIVNGTLNGIAVVKDIQTRPTFTTDITVNDLSIYSDTIGNFTAKVNNDVANTFHANLSLNGRGNDVSINGDYKVDSANSSFDFLVNLSSLQMKAVEGFSNGAIRDARGFMYGKVALNGTLKDPNIDGKIQFNNTAFNVSSLNNVFKIDKEAIAIVNNKGIELNQFSIRDTANQAITIDGTVNTTDFLNYAFNLKIRARDFQAINSTVRDNQLFYGKMLFSTNLTVKGTPAHPIVDGDLSINNKTDFTVVLPQGQQGIESHEGIVRFVNKSAASQDSLLMAPYDSLKTSSLHGYDVSLNIRIDKDAVFKVIVDAGNGDYLRIKGKGQFTAGVDISGKTTLVGSYEIEDGSYDFSFDFLKKKFKIQKGSRIVWTGDPTSAQIDITAVYIANTAPYDLVNAQSASTSASANVFRQKLPFEVDLLLKGELLRPQISFDIRLPKDKNFNVSEAVINTVDTKLDQLRQDPDDMNKQVFALLLLGRFIGEDPFNNGAGGTSAGAFAMQSVSKLLTEQLNSLAQNLVQGVDINFDLSTTQDYTTGSEQDRTKLNVGVSKRLLSDRLTVTVGSDFELSGPAQPNRQPTNLAGNISVNYKLSKDGKYMLRAYRKNDYTDVIEGYVIETGIGFVISVDYDKFSQLFSTKEQRRKKKEIKKDNKKTEKADAASQQNS